MKPLLTSLLLVPCVVVAEDTRTIDRSPRAVLTRGLTFLAREGPAFQKGKKCVTCHHGPFAIWSQREAKRAGLPVTDDDLTSFQASLVKRNYNKTSRDSLGWNHTLSAFWLLAQSADWTPEDDPRLTKTALAALDTAQGEDGGWHGAKQFRNQIRPGENEQNLLQSCWNVLALDRLGAGEDVIELRDAALTRIRSAPSPGATDVRAVRLLVEDRHGESKTTAELLAKLLADQNEDGSWGWTADSPGDPWATGVTLYVLGRLSADVPREPIANARSFLLAAQAEDGSWHTETKQDPADTGPKIATFFGTAWAVMGLSRTE